MGAQAVGSGLNAAGEAVGNAGRAAGEAVGNAGQQAFQATKDFGNQAVQGAQQLGNQALQTGQQALDRTQQFGSGAYDAAAGGINSAAGSATQGLRANVGGLGRAFTGESRGFPAGRDQSYNEIGSDIAAQDQRAQQGMQQMQGAFGKSGTAFEALGMEKEALAQVVGSGLKFVGRKLVDSGVRARRNAMQKTQNTLNTGRYGPRTDAERAAFATASQTGKGRAGVGNAMSSAGKTIDKSPGIKNSINAAGLAGVGAGAYGLLGGAPEIREANPNSPMGMGQYTGMGIQIPKSERPASAEAAIPKAIPVDPDPNPGFAEAYRNASPAEQKRIRETSGRAPATPKKAPDYDAQFRKEHGGAFDPNSRVDRQKMQILQQKSAFEALGMEKEALAQAVAKGLGWGSKAIGNLGTKSWRKARETAMAADPSLRKIDAARNTMDSGKNLRSAGKALLGASSKIDDTPWLKNTINTAGVTGLGAGAYGIGSGRGERRGIGKGLTEGIGIGSAHAYQPDPGVLGRLGQLFTGTPQADMSALNAWLNENKDEVIKKILSRK
jgi:hypothetical protein